MVRPRSTPSAHHHQNLARVPPQDSGTRKPKRVVVRPMPQLEFLPPVYPHLVNSLPPRWSFIGRNATPQRPHWYQA